MTATSLTSWGHFPHFAQTPNTVHWRDDVQAVFENVRHHFGTCLPYGNGRSYGDVCMAETDQVIAMRRVNRMIAADWNTGVIVAEAGLTLDELLGICVPRGWFVPVTPGTKFVTLGGAVANDVHGKNHHQYGTFGKHVRSFGLTRSDSGAMICSADANAEMYAATIGGLGLTGIITWVELQLKPIRSNQISATSVRFDRLSEFFTLSTEFDATHEHTAAWIDCLGQGASFGRGVFLAGNHADDGVLTAPDDRQFTMPIMPPVSMVNALSLKAFNAAYFYTHNSKRTDFTTTYDSFLYPLDRVKCWNRLYGKAGFQQYQCIIPHAQAEVAVSEMLHLIAKARTGSFLTVLKKFGGSVSPGLMSFPMPGITLALDFPQRTGLSEGLFARLNTILRAVNGRLYPAKDAHMSGEDFRRAYPAWQTLDGLRDPALLSRFWKRVTQ